MNSKQRRAERRKFKHIVNIKVGYFQLWTNDDKTKELAEWVNDHLQKPAQFGWHEARFNSEKDAILFTLTFGESLR